MVNLFESFRKIKKKKILVIGDLMLDSYTIGSASRISPEAPVAVVHVEHQEDRPGGAGNVSLNLISLGADVLTIGRVGDDKYAEKLRTAFKEQGAEVSEFIVQQGYCTPVKNRIIAGNQQIVRVDIEENTPLPSHSEEEVFRKLSNAIKDVDLIAISDYGKGFITSNLMQGIVSRAKEHNIPVIVDPKGVDFSKYIGVDLIKPNLSEVYAAANLPSTASLDDAAFKVFDSSKVPVLMVTRSGDGISLFETGRNRQDFPVRVREVKDVTGAGDTVLAMLAFSLANGLDLADAIQLCNVVAGLAIEKMGCARITRAELAGSLLSENSSNKVFDEEHLHVLVEALHHRDLSILKLSTKEGISTKLLSRIRQFARNEKGEFLIHIYDSDPDNEVIEVLASLHDVDYIVTITNPNIDLVNQLSPKEVYY